jgi:hypothetical protein
VANRAPDNDEARVPPQPPTLGAGEPRRAIGRSASHDGREYQSSRTSLTFSGDHSSEINHCDAVVERRVNVNGAGSAHHRAELSRMPHLDMGLKITSSAQISIQWFEFHPTHPYDLGGDEHGVEWTTPTCPDPGATNTDGRPKD